MPYQSDHVFDESYTVVLTQIYDKMLSPLRFQCAAHIRLSQKEFANLEHELIRECCGGFLLTQKPDQFFKKFSVLSPAIQGLSFLI